MKDPVAWLAIVATAVFMVLRFWFIFRRDD
jgi:hypothetical protein